MKIDPKKEYAVITGDFIGFSGLPAEVRQQMYFVLKDCGKALESAFPGILPCEVDVFRGDGWQALINDSALSLRAALFIRAYIRFHLKEKATEKGSETTTGAEKEIKIDTRLAIGVGFIDYVPDNRVSAGDGPAFRASGKLLERMSSPKSGTMRFAAEGAADIRTGRLLDGIVRLAGELADRWTSKQALAVTGALQGWSHQQITRLWPGGIVPQTVGNHLQKAGWNAIDHGLRIFEAGLGGIRETG
ncbi:MAG: hypothetical protein C4518_05455 [Desulfobacteraceae bacterium]|nr:MAG: hypothetical protein C4518_05455 [Desulfobacteraceae bacterium]